MFGKCQSRQSICKENLVLDNGPGSEKSAFSGEENSPQGAWDHIADEMLLEFAGSRHLVFRATTLLSRGLLKSKGHGKLSIHFAADEHTIETVFSHHNFCQSTLQNENSLNHQILWQQYIERIESLSPESKVSRFCKEAGFLRIVEVGQYFMTKDTVILDNFVQWLVVNTLFLETVHLHKQKGGFKET